MPFPMVYRLPRSMSTRDMLLLRRSLVDITSTIMACPKKWVGVELFKTTLPEAFDEEDGCSTVLIKLETGMFSDSHIEPYIVVGVLKALSDAVWDALDGKFEVEASVTKWDSRFVYLREAGK